MTHRAGLEELLHENLGALYRGQPRAAPRQAATDASPACCG